MLWREFPHLKQVAILLAGITILKAGGNCHGGTSHYDRIFLFLPFTPLNEAQNFNTIKSHHKSYWFSVEFFVGHSRGLDKRTWKCFRIKNLLGAHFAVTCVRRFKTVRNASHYELKRCFCFARHSRLVIYIVRKLGIINWTFFTYDEHKFQRKKSHLLDLVRI